MWRNYKPDAVDEHGNRRGRNGALRALACAGTPLADLQKPTRLAALKRYERAPLLTALDPYLKLADLESDTRDWLELYYEDGRLYPNVNFFSQVTGRSAYSHPALQNIAKEFEGGTFRDCIRAPEGHAIVKCDYSAQELRILAHITQDENLLGAFRAQAEGDKDPHLIVGEKLAGEELERDTPEWDHYRKLGKRINYGFSYGAGWRRHQRTVYEDTATLISNEQAKSEKQAFVDSWPGVVRWQGEFGSRQGNTSEDWYTLSYLGRRRYVSRSSDGTPMYTDRCNGPIQSGGADMLLIALSRLIDDKVAHLDAWVIITTHDEIVLEAAASQAEEVLAWLRAHMRECCRQLLGEDLATEDCVEGKVGESWAS